MKYILIFLLAIFLFGCNTEKRALEKTQLYLFKHPEYSAGYCSEQFPDKKDSVIIRETETKTDTLWGVIDHSDTLTINDTIRIVDTKVKTVIKTIYRDSVIYRENKAEERRLELVLQTCQANNNIWLNKYTEQEKLLASWKGKAKTRWWWIALLIGGAAAFTAFKIFKFKLPINLKT